ncbi:MAG TPA: ADP-ribosylglycohydrolase family protein, partial [Methylococcales bacterium]
MMNHKNYQAKAMGGWLGKNIGGTLGGPHEGKLAVLNLHFYDPVPTEPMANDDLDLQLVWLDMLRRKGVYITPYDFAECWNEKITYHIAEYFMGQRNLAHGLMPPVTGWF